MNEQTGFVLDWDRYYINRGRSWSRSDGTGGAVIFGLPEEFEDSPSMKATLFCLDGALIRFLPERYFFVLDCETPRSYLGAVKIFRGHKDENGRMITD